MIRVFFGVPKSYGNSPGEVVGLNGPYGKRDVALGSEKPERPGGINGPPWASLEREEGSQGRTRPPLQSELDKGRGRRPPFLLPLPLLPSPSLPFGGILLLGLLEFGLPLSFSPEGGRKEGRGERKGESYSLYFLSSSPFPFST